MNKKLLSLFAVFAGVGVTFAQPTFNSTDEAAIGTNLNYYLGDTTGFDLKETTNGANATWDWSSLTLNAAINQRIGEVNDASADVVYSPLGATHNFEIQDYLNQYYNFSATVKHSQGFRYTTAGTELAIVEFDSASYNMMEYPFDYTDMINNTIAGTTTLNLQGNIQTAPSTQGTGVIEYDGYGTLMLPDTTFTNVARIHQRDSVRAPFAIPVGNVDFVVDRYDYYDPTNLDIPVFICSRVRIYTGGLLPQFDPVVSIYSAVPLAVSNLSTNDIESIENSIEIFPNPATSNFTLRFDTKDASNSEIKLVDLTGKTVQIIANGTSKGLNTFNINTTSLTKGVYFVEIAGNENTITKKVIIQ
jgi:hypothetical protein